MTLLETVIQDWEQPWQFKGRLPRNAPKIIFWIAHTDVNRTIL